MTKEQLEKLYKAKDEKEVLDIISKEGIVLTAEELEMVNGGEYRPMNSSTPLKDLKDILEENK